MEKDFKWLLKPKLPFATLKVPTDERGVCTTQTSGHVILLKKLYLDLKIHCEVKCTSVSKLTF